MENALVIAVLLLIAGSCSCRDISQQLKPQPRIVGGSDVSTYLVPYQVSVRRRNSVRSAYTHTCGGVLLDERTVLTAAHCVYKRLAENFILVAGSDVRAGMDGGVVTRVEQLVPHEKYNASIADNDIALVFVSPPFPVGHRKINTIELAEKQPPAGTVATVSGWGLTQADGFGSAQLQQTSVSLVDRSDCQAAYDWRPITESMLCAAHPGGGQDACEGDSGGPLVAEDKLVGIVTFSEGCAQPGYPSVYASVPHFQEWIAEQRAAHARSAAD